MQYRKLKDLKKLEGNPRIIRDKQFQNLVASIRENPKYFEARPLVLSNRTGELVIIAGNQRYEAAKVVKLKEVPTYLMEGITEDKEKEITIRDNTQQGEWDFDALANSWSDLPLTEWGVSLPEDWLAPPAAEPADADAQIDKAEELNKIWKCATGDLWKIGDHRLLCGDSTKAEDVARVMGGEKAALCLTDPPYNVGINFGETTDDKRDDYEQWSFLWHSLATENSDAVLLTPGIANMGMWFKIEPRWVIAWFKTNSMKRATIGFNCWEPIFLWGKPPLNIYRDCIEVAIVKQDDADGHPTPKPVQLFEKVIEGFSETASMIYDPFLGSGTTMVACQNLNRKCRGIEISEAYCSVILQRMQDAFPTLEIRRIEP